MKLEKLSWIAGIFAAIIGVVAWLVDRNDFIAFCKSCWKIIRSPFVFVFGLLTHPVTWPVWLLILVLLVVLVAPAICFWFFVKTSNAPNESLQPPQVSPFDYKSDEIFGVEWIWSYIYGSLNENDLSAFCPKKSCMCRLTIQEHPERMAVRNAGYGASLSIPVSFTCTACGFSRQFDSDWKKLKHDVFLEIERRIRTGEFQQRMTQQKS
jgi:hypothetical protein